MEQRDLNLDNIEAQIKEQKPSTLVGESGDVWYLPHDSEQWVKVRRLTALEVREFQAVAAKTSSSLSNPDKWDMELKPADSYFYLLSRCIVEYCFKESDKVITGKSQYDRQGRLTNEQELRAVFGRLDPLIAAWLERKLLIFNHLVR